MKKEFLRKKNPSGFFNKSTFIKFFDCFSFFMSQIIINFTQLILFIDILKMLSKELVKKIHCKFDFKMFKK